MEANTTGVNDEKTPGIFTFVIADMCIFAMLFIGFMVDRSNQLTVFEESAAKLNIWFGVGNTLILVTSGLFVVLAVEAAREGKEKLFRRWLCASFVVGAGFGVTKSIEYHEKISNGMTMLSNDFFMFYYALTGAHFLHFIAGMLALGVIGYRSANEDVDGQLFPIIQSVALYWHMVDLLWIFIFPVVYLLSLA